MKAKYDKLFTEDYDKVARIFTETLKYSTAEQSNNRKQCI